MEIIRLNSLQDDWRSRSIGQKIAMALMAGMLVAGSVGIVSVLAKPPLISHGDYSPFASKQEYDAFVKAHPAMTKKAPLDAHFHYRASVSPNKQAVFQITLLSVPIRPTDKDATSHYVDSLKQFQKEAKDWFKRQGEDISRDYVQWSPNPDSFGPTPTPTPHPMGQLKPSATPASK